MTTKNIRRTPAPLAAVTRLGRAILGAVIIGTLAFAPVAASAQTVQQAIGYALGTTKRANVFTAPQSILASLGVGTTTATARLQVQTEIGFTGYAVDVYQYATQGLGTNTVLLFAGHNYTDSDTMALDTVGAGVTLRLKQANNAAARADKVSTYIGTGPFLWMQRANLGGGFWPSGNQGNGNDLLTYFNSSGSLVFNGVNAADWDGGSTTAPIQIGTYQLLTNRLGYLGYDDTNNKLIIGAIDRQASAFTPVDFAASAVRPVGDNAVSLGASSKRWSNSYAVTFHPGAGASNWTTGTGSPIGTLNGTIGDIFGRTDGGVGQAFYVKEASTGTVNGWARVQTVVAVPFASLPATPLAGQRALVTDATACTFATAVTVGGGSTACPVVYSGAAWIGG